MTAVISFDEWVVWRRIALPKAKNLTCPACKGSATAISEKTQKAVKCCCCRGSGLVSARKLPVDPRIEQYIEHVAGELKRLCVWSRRDYLDEMSGFLSGFQHRARGL